MGNCLRTRTQRDSETKIVEVGQRFERKVKNVGGCILGRSGSLLSNYSTTSRHVVEPPVRIGAFNVQRFGKSKVMTSSPTKNAKAKAPPSVVEILTKIICRYDILLVQEVVDSSGEAIKELLDLVNSESENGEYSLEISPRLGRNKSKEQYAFFYKSKRFKMVKSAVFDDSEEDAFIREPFIVQFSSSCLASDIENFVLVALHTQPKNAAVEIDKVDDVIRWTKKKFRTSDVIILGDLNASAPYVSAADWKTNRLKNNPKCHWLIQDHVDTTANHTLAAYDRIIFYGDNLIKLVIDGSAKPFRYDQHRDFQNVNQELLLKVSDHYPVEVQLKSRLHPILEKSVRLHQNVVLFEDNRPMPETFSVRDSEKIAPFNLDLYYDDSRHLVLAELEANFPNSKSAHSGLKILQENSILPYSLFALAVSRVKELEPSTGEILVNIRHKFEQQKTLFAISQI